MKYKIYCDGATSNNGYSNAVGGYAGVVLNENEEIIYEYAIGPIAGATNNRMELYAALEGLWYCVDHFSEDNELYVDVYTDSAYLHNCMRAGWYKKWVQNGWINSGRQPVANKDLWEALIPFFEDMRFGFYKVKGHTGENDWNDYVDKLAVKAKTQEVSNG